MKWSKGGRSARHARIRRNVLIIGSALGAASQVHAFSIDTDNEDVQMRWDNTVRYNLAYRAEDQDRRLLGSLNNNDGNRNFDQDSFVSNRIDLLSEFDFIYRRSHGFRISAAAWYDQAYESIDAPSAAGSNHLSGGIPAVGLDSTTKRYHRGPSGEFLDAFAFTRLDIGDSPLYVKGGSHTVYWGESLFLGGVIHGIAYAQSPLDVAKGLSIPGAEAKELFRPLNNISANFQANDELSLAAQYFFDWKPFRYPEAGSYLGFSDAIMDGGESVYTPLGLLPRLGDIEPEKRGDLGVSARWSPEWLDGTVGVYYRNFTNKIPQTVLDVRGHPMAGVPGQPLGYRLSYGDDVDLIGISLSKQIGGVSVGAEISYRENMPLNSDPVLVADAAIVAAAKAGVPGLEAFVDARTALPAQGETGAARGNTTHIVVNVLGQVAGTSLFDSLDWKAELTWNTWNKVTKNRDLFKGRSSYTGLDRVTNDASGFAMTIEPKWYQVFPSVDLMLPVAFSTGLSGTSAVAQGGAKGVGAYSIGIAADYRNQYRFDLKYVDFFGDIDANNPSAVVARDNPAYLKDRGMLVLNFKTTF